MLSVLDISIILLYLILSVAISLWYSHKASKNIKEYFLSGRNLPWWLAGTSMVATTFAADTPLAVAEIVYHNGISGNWLWWNALIGGMITTFFFAKLWQKANVMTDISLIQIRYSGTAAQVLRMFRAIYIGVFMNAVIIGWVNLALITILQVFFKFSYLEALGFTFLCMLFTAFYASLSGLWGVTVTDAIQFVIAMIGCIVLAVMVVNHEKIGGIEGLKSKLAPETLNFLPNFSLQNVGKTMSISVGTFLTYVAVQWWASWYPGAEPGGGGYVAQRMLACKSPKDAFWATFLFQVLHYGVRPWAWIIVGLCALILYPDLKDEQVKFGYVYAMRDFLPNGLRGLLLVAFFAAYMSTIATQLNWGASYWINDIYATWIKVSSQEKQLVWISRIGTFGVMLAGLIATLLIDSVKQAWEFLLHSSAGLGFVLIARWYWWRISAWSEIVATISPFIIYSTIFLLKPSLESSTTFLIVTFGTVFFTLLATYFLPSTDVQTLQNFYNSIQPEGWWQPFSKKPVNRAFFLRNAITVLLSIVMIYSGLFATGALILQQYEKLLVYTLCMLICITAFLNLTKKVGSFE
ncbi:MAG: Na+:solute symporter [Bacteroidia bacterium]|nr:Na+:solute symporter [Bacteroidia bacterium]MDW8300986.1 sodium:solute symporter family protein [Bacteroidia bacterium]